MCLNEPRIILDIADLAFGGEGVGRAPDGRAVFVPFTVPGERVVAEITRSSARFCRAEVREILHAAPSRVLPPCPLFGRCGGCQYQHMDYPAQVMFKSGQLVPVLERLGGLKALPAPPPPTASSVAYGYRNKLTLEPIPAAGDYGFFALDNQTVIAVEQCPLAGAGLNQLLPRAKSAPASRRNLALRSPQPLVLRQPAADEPLFFFGSAAHTLPPLVEQVDGKPVTVPAAGFWQVNPGVAAELVATLKAWFAVAPTPLLVDAYAGAGVFSLALGHLCQEAVVIEANAASLAAAERNHRDWGLKAGTFLRATTEAALPGLLRQLGTRRRQSTVILDPPRCGCLSPVLAALTAMPVHQVAYVSCNAATLARDLRTLCVAGPYAIRRLAWFDMFPQTAHFETAVWLEA